MTEYRAQEQDLIYALDIGTRSVVGVAGKSSGGRFKALAIEMAEHGSRAMLDGQIDNIQQVAALARTVNGRAADAGVCCGGWTGAADPERDVQHGYIG